MFDGRVMKEVVATPTPAAARALIEARYPGCRVISVAS